MCAPSAWSSPTSGENPRLVTVPGREIWRGLRDDKTTHCRSSFFVTQNPRSSYPIPFLANHSSPIQECPVSEFRIAFFSACFCSNQVGTLNIDFGVINFGGGKKMEKYVQIAQVRFVGTYLTFQVIYVLKYVQKDPLRYVGR